MQKENEIKVVGLVQPEEGSGKVHFQDYIYDINGIARTTCARDYKDPMRILVCKTRMKS